MDGIGISGNVSLDMNVQSVAGVYKYDELRDKPKINDVEVSGSKSLDDYGIASKADIDCMKRFVTPEMLGYKSGDATEYINECLTIARENGYGIILSGTYETSETIHMSYKDTIYSVGSPQILSSANPIIAFDVDHITQSDRNRKPFNGNALTIINSTKTMKSDDSTVGILLNNAEEVVISNINVYYLGRGIDIEGNNNYIITFDNCLIEYNHYGVYYNAGSNSGERPSFTNCTFGHCRSAFYNTQVLEQLSFYNTSFDFCANVLYEEKASNCAVSFNACHIEGTGYHGNDFPKIDSDSYGIVVFNAVETYNYHEIYAFNSCVMHCGQMQDELGLPLIVHNIYSSTFIANCKLSSKRSTTLTMYPISNGYCDKGIYGQNGTAYVGSKVVPRVIINGPYASMKEDKTTIIYNGDAGTSSLLYNFPYVTGVDSNNFIIDVEGDVGLSFNGWYSFGISGKTYVNLPQKLNCIKVNSINASGRSITFNGIYPLQ